MKRILTTIQKRANKILSIAILAGAITSCDSILNYNEDCDIEYCVKFKYDYNMEEKDVFAEQVRSVTLMLLMKTIISSIRTRIKVNNWEI